MASFNLRLPESLHARVRVLAEKDGISLNQFILLAVAEKAAVLDSVYSGYLANRADNVEGDAKEHLRQLLDSQARDVAPAAGDE